MKHLRKYALPTFKIGLLTTLVAWIVWAYWPDSHIEGIPTTSLLDNGLLLAPLVVVFAWLNSSSRWANSKFIKKQYHKFSILEETHPTTKFEDIAGYEDIKRLMESYVVNVRDSQVGDFKKTSGNLLVAGPEGSGKLLLAQALAGEAGVPLFIFTCIDLIGRTDRASRTMVSKIFRTIRKSLPAVVFIDDLDALFRHSRSGIPKQDQANGIIVGCLRMELRNRDQNRGLVLLAATNKLSPDIVKLDCFERRINLSLPDRRMREGILRIHTKDFMLASDVNLGQIARSTPGLNGSDLVTICKQAVQIAALEKRTLVTVKDLEIALEQVLLSSANPSFLDESLTLVMAYHQAGHVLAVWNNPLADLFRQVTILSHDFNHEIYNHVNSIHTRNYSYRYLLTILRVMLAGRAAEVTALGEATTLAEPDLAQANRIALFMISRWGMGGLGLFAPHAQLSKYKFNMLSRHLNVSENSSEKIDQGIRDLLKKQYNTTLNLMHDARQSLDQLAHALLEDETLTVKEVEKILGPRTYSLSAELPVELAEKVAKEGFN